MTENRNRHLAAKHAGSAPRRMRGRVEVCAVAALFLLVVLAALAPKIRAQSTNKATNQSTNGATNKDFEWPTYSADLAGTRYRPLDQIDASNFNKLEVAWTFKTDNLGPTPEFRLEGTPLMVGGVVYATAGTRKAVVALDATTGELLWMHSINEGERAAVAPRRLSGRGLAYWSNGKEARVLYVTIGYRLVSLDAKTGIPDPAFGENGVLDLKVGVEYGAGQQIDLEKGEIALHAAPVVVKDEILVGSAFEGGNHPKTHTNTKGLARAFDVRTGKMLWAFRTIPKPGEFGNDTWLDGSWDKNGNTGIWAQISVDEELNLAYLPVEMPTGDHYGGHRPGNGLFGDSLVAVDLKTGERKWYYQLIHHGLWDMDIPAAPVLADITVNGRTIKALAQPTKQGILYVFDRTNGKPVWPFEEKPVEKGTVPGEWYSPTQPIPTKPKAYARNGVTVDDLIDFTPELRAQALQISEHYKFGPVFTPPEVNNGDQLGTLTLGTSHGGTDWPGGSYDPETHIIYVQACNACLRVKGMIPPKPGTSDMNYVVDMGRINAISRLPVQGLPLIKPPYGTITAINLDTGEFVWQIPHGTTPDEIRNSPVLKGLDIPPTGQADIAGTLVTKTLVICGDPNAVTIPSHGKGAMLHAYDKATGKEVGAVFMPAPQVGSPMTYMANGRQYIVIGISGDTASEYIAYRLPKE